jgi:hypothetical protein
MLDFNTYQEKNLKRGKKDGKRQSLIDILSTRES